MTTPYIHGVTNTTTHPKCERKGCGRYIPDVRSHHAKFCSEKCANAGRLWQKRPTIRPMKDEDLRLLALLK